MASRLELVYHEGHSFFHRTDPLSKLLYVIAVSFLMATGFDFYKQLGMLLIVAPIALILSGVPFRSYWAFIKYVFFLTISLGITGALFVHKPGPVVLHTPLRDLSFRELTDGFTMGLQMFNLGWVSLGFVFTTHPRDFAHAVSRLGLSYRFSHGLILALVFLPTLLAEANNVSNAHKIRDFGADQNWVMRRYNSLRHLFFALVARSLRRAETIAIAMDVKGFGLSGVRTYFTQYPTWLAGKIFGWASVVVAIALLLTIWL